MEQTVDEPAFSKLDPELTFFKDILKLRDDAIQHVFAYIFSTILTVLIFSASPPNETYQRSIEDVHLYFLITLTTKSL